MWQRFGLLVALAALLWPGIVAAQQSGLGSREIEAMQGERRVALVVGNAAYGPNIGPLENPANDARDIAEALRQFGFEVALALDVDRDQMRRAVIDFGQSLRDGGVGLFYFSGHAVQVDGFNYLIPLGADVASADYVPVETVDVNEVLARMGGAENRLNIVILDACRNNPFKGEFRSVTRGLAQMLAPTGTFIAYAAAPGQLALDGQGTRNSPYTAALLHALRGPDLRLEDVFKRVGRDVLEHTARFQTPWTGSSITGDFYFRLPQVVEAAPEPTPMQDRTGFDVVAWHAIKDSSSPADFDTFLETYPDSSLVAFAESRLEVLRATAPETPAGAEESTVALVTPPAKGKAADEPTETVQPPPVAAQNLFRLAKSSSLGLEIFVEHDGTRWCSDRLKLRVEAQDPGVYASANMPNLLRKLAKVVETECSAAQTASLRGYTVGEDQPVYEGALRFEAN